MPNAEPLLDRHFLERLERLTIHWQRSFAGLVGGHNTSRFSGGGQEFLDHRNFHHGDDLRAVNWRAYLRLEKLFLKMFQIEPRVPVHMLLDTSASMATRRVHRGVKRIRRYEEIRHRAQDRGVVVLHRSGAAGHHRTAAVFDGPR